MKNFLFLGEAKLGITYKIVGMCKTIDIKTKTRLFELGFFNGENVKIINKSFMGGVLLIEIHNTILSVRKLEANCVVVS